MKFSLTAAALPLALATTMLSHVQAGPARDSQHKHKPLRAIGMALKSSEDLSDAISGAPFFAAHPARHDHKIKSGSRRRRRRIDDAVAPAVVDRRDPAPTKVKRVCTRKATTTAWTTTMTTQTVTTDHPHPSKETDSPSSVHSNSPKATGGSDDSNDSDSDEGGNKGNSSSSCFPALDFKMPTNVPDSVDNWWCSTQDEQAWLGFSYDVSWCPSSAQLTKSFKRMRSEYNARYVRMYGTCDNDGFTDQLINAGWEAGLGIYPLIWFGFDGDNKWQTRRDNIIKAIKSNSKAPYVVRGVVVGSEPMFDSVMSPDDLAAQIYNVKNQLAPWTNKGDDGMQITLSEMPYGYQIRSNAPQVFKAQDTLMAHSLPFFDWTVGDAGSDSTAGKVQNDLNYMVKNGLGKKIIISQTGWPSNADIWKPNSAKAVASLQQEKAYFDMLDNLACSWMAKNGPKGGIAWFSHMYADTLSGWGVLDTNWKAKFDFKPKTSC